MNYQFSILVPTAIAYTVRRCHESPWGEEEVFNEEIYEWLDFFALPSGWDHDIYPDGKHCIVFIDDCKVAMLFKLLWT